MRQQPVPPWRQLHRLRGQLHVHLPRGLQWDPLREQHARLHREVGGPTAHGQARCAWAEAGREMGRAGHAQCLASWATKQVSTWSLRAS